jgi:hypothetical protein
MLSAKHEHAVAEQPGNRGSPELQSEILVCGHRGPPHPYLSPRRGGTTSVTGRSLLVGQARAALKRTQSRRWREGGGDSRAGEQLVFKATTMGESGRGLPHSMTLARGTGLSQFGRYRNILPALARIGSHWLALRWRTFFGERTSNNQHRTPNIQVINSTQLN